MNLPISNRPIQSYYQPFSKAKAIEILFWVYLIYSIYSQLLGIYIPYLAAGLLGLLAISSLVSINWKDPARVVFILIVAIVGLFLLIQIFMFAMPFSMPEMNQFLVWVVSAVVVFYISRRNGFIKRLAIVMFLIGISVRPYGAVKMEIVARQGFNSGTILDNANGYADWMGFCALIFWMWGWRQKKLLRRIVLWASSVTAIVFLLGTVSRGSLLALAIGGLIGIRGKSWKKKFVYVGVMCIAVVIILGLAPSAIGDYQARLTEETGRLANWPFAVQAIVSQPMWGYGIDRVVNRWRSAGGAILAITPHNGILYMWLSSGALPGLLFILLWVVVILRGYQNHWLAVAGIDSLPLIIYGFLQMNLTNVYFLTYPALAAFFYCYQTKPTNKNPLD